MTREEAIALLNEQYETCKRIYDCSADQRKSYPNVPQFMEALGMALSALRPVSREQVEKYLVPLTDQLIMGVIAERSAGMTVREEDKQFIAQLIATKRELPDNWDQ